MGGGLNPLCLLWSDRRRDLAEAEDSRVAQTQGGDGGPVAQRGLVVAVPADAVAAVSVQVAEQRVEAAAAALRHGLTEAPQQRRPLRRQGHTRFNQRRATLKDVQRCGGGFCQT